MAWLTDNVFVQSIGEPLEHVLTALPHAKRVTPKVRHFAHILNPYACPAVSEGFQIQQLTYTSLVKAQAYTENELEVTHVAVVLPEDLKDLPEIFARRATLERSVQDLCTFSVPRKLPLLFDILEKGGNVCRDGDYIIFTNMDIALMPQFYEAVSRLIDVGFEAMTINRRTIGKYDLDPSWAPLMTSECGERHPGLDCFVFPSRFLRQFVASQACVGAGGVMRSLLFNLVAFARPLLMLKDVHMTFHLGNDLTWIAPNLKEYQRFNRRQSQQVLDRLAEDTEKHRLLELFCDAHQEKYKIGTDPLSWTVAGA